MKQNHVTIEKALKDLHDAIVNQTGDMRPTIEVHISQHAMNVLVSELGVFAEFFVDHSVNTANVCGVTVKVDVAHRHGVTNDE